MQPRRALSCECIRRAAFSPGSPPAILERLLQQAQEQQRAAYEQKLSEQITKFAEGKNYWPQIENELCARACGSSWRAYSTCCRAQRFWPDRPYTLNGALIQCCAPAFVLESLLVVLTAKIVLQHIHCNSGQMRVRSDCPLCAKSRHF